MPPTWLRSLSRLGRPLSERGGWGGRPARCPLVALAALALLAIAARADDTLSHRAQHVRRTRTLASAARSEGPLAARSAPGATATASTTLTVVIRPRGTQPASRPEPLGVVTRLEVAPGALDPRRLTPQSWVTLRVPLPRGVAAEPDPDSATLNGQPALPVSGPAVVAATAGAPGVLELQFAADDVLAALEPGVGPRQLTLETWLSDGGCVIAVGVVTVGR